VSSLVDVTPGAIVRLEQTLPAPPDAVWEYLVDARLRARWLGPGKLEPRRGGRVDLHLRDHDGKSYRVVGQVVAIDPPHAMELSWHPPGGEPERVRIELVDQGSGTEMRVTHGRDRSGRGQQGGVALVAALPGLALLLQERGAVPASSAALGRAAASGPGGSMGRPPRGSMPSLWKVSAVVIILVGAGAGAGLLYEVSHVHKTSYGFSSCLNFSGSRVIAEPGPSGDNGWGRIANLSCAPWMAAGVPVVFFWGSIACPYCDASSWAVEAAVQNFSFPSPFTTVLGNYVVSSPGDVYPQTPGLNLGGGVNNSAYVTFIPQIGENPDAITVPALSPPASTYKSADDSAGGVPFLVIGGVFVHTGTLVNPAVFSTGSSVMTPSAVASAINACDGDPNASTFCQQVLLPQLYLEAYLYRTDEVAGVAPPIQYLGWNPSDLARVQQLAASIQ
jgi:uncharacterized protein YndB with AHSA1/START domain